MARGFETVVIGAGSSGAVIAARVSERPGRDLLLVEAGPDYADPQRLPRDLDDGTRNSFRAHDWGYTHRPNARQLAFPLPRGKVVGGSSAVNTCIALRGVPADYDEWASRGLPEWRWEACLPAFIRLENDLDVRNEYHGQRGPVPLRRHSRDELAPWQAAFLDACASLGFPAAPDHNDPHASGYGPHAMNKIDGHRMSTARCYLTPAVRARDNFALRPLTHVRRVLFRGRKAVGVELSSAGAIERVEATRVVICAGAIATPGVLLRSGIGPRAAVERLGVAPLVDLPAVGARLLDHPGAAFFLRPRHGLWALDHALIQTALRMTSGKTGFDNDVQIQPGSGLHTPWGSAELVSLMVSVGKPRGYGLLEYTSAAPDALPTIHSRLLEHPADRAFAVDALLTAYRVACAGPMRDLARPVWPPAWVLSSRTRLESFVRQICDSGYHASGTVPMGADDDPSAALDQYGRVRGVEGLIVADASVMPTIPTSNTNLPTMMIGERFGEWLRDGPL